MNRRLTKDALARRREHGRRLEALKIIEEAARCRGQSLMRLEVIDSLLFKLDEDFSDSDVRRILMKRKYPIDIEKALTLYGTMHRLMRLCTPCGRVTGPSARIKLVDFTNLTLDEALDLRGGPSFLALIAGLPNPKEFVGLDLLTQEEQSLYEDVRPYFKRPNRLTLKSLAAELLQYNERSTIRYVQELNGYRFRSEDISRDYLIKSVNEFGTCQKTMRESAAEFQAHLNRHPMIKDLFYATPLR